MKIITEAFEYYIVLYCIYTFIKHLSQNNYIEALSIRKPHGKRNTFTDWETYEDKPSLPTTVYH